MKNLLFVLALAACGSKTPVAPAPVPAPVEAAASALAEPEMLPPAFDVETLHQGFKVGTVLRFEVSTETAGLSFQEWTVTAADDAGCTVHLKDFAADGVSLTAETDYVHTWTELSSLGTFPAATTTRTASTVEFGGKPLETVYYVHDAADPSEPDVSAHFAPTLVGPPVLLVLSAGDAVYGTAKMLSYTAP